jgi:hypothetical protein
MENKYHAAALVRFTLQNGSEIVINAHAVVSVNVFGSTHVSAIRLMEDDKMYIVPHSPSFIKSQLEDAINKSKQ